MTCKQLTESLDDYVDASLGETETTRLEQHLSGCGDCQQRVSRERQLRKLLSEYGDSSMPTPTASYFDQALITAATTGGRKQRNRSWMTGFGSAIAAGLAIWVLSGVLLSPTATGPADSSIPLVTMALAEPRTINLVFSSASTLKNATLTVLLPAGVELAGFAGQREISWSTSLEKGNNLLPLRLIALYPGTGELLATLKHGDDDRTFRLRIDVG